MTVASHHTPGRRVARALSMLGILLLASPVSAAAPLWWTTRGVLDDSSATNDYAAATMGQLKWIATNAYAELDAGLPDGAGTNIPAVLDAWLDDGTNYVPVNVGQLKNLAALFYDRLIAHGYTNAYPWAEGSDSADYSVANVGQVRQLFSFSLDTDEDGLPDWWELQHFGSVTQTLAAGDIDMDGYDNREEFSAGTDPTNRAVLPGSVFYVSTTGSDTNAGTWDAPFQYIAAGIAAATNGMRVVVLPGTYMGASNRNLSLLGKAIGVVGIANGNFETILDADNAGRGFVINQGETRDTLLRNMVILRGRAASGIGGGAALDGASPTVERCAFIDCSSAGNGAGVSVSAGSPRILGCVFRGNIASSCGAALYLAGTASVELRDSLVDANTAKAEGALYLAGSATALLANNTFTHNDGPAMVAEGLSILTNVNAIVAFNGIGIRQAPNALLDIRATCVYGNTDGNYVGLPLEPTGADGNISEDPLFVNHLAGNLRLLPDSPCRSAADTQLQALGTVDAQGMTRLAGQPADMGGYRGGQPQRDAIVHAFYVREGGSGSGTSWADASGDLADMLTSDAVLDAYNEGESVEIRVAQGVYTGGFAYELGRGTLRGGYRGKEPGADVQNPARYRTILDGGGTQRVWTYLYGGGSVRLEDVTLEGGYASAGAAVLVSGGGVVLEECTIQDNDATHVSNVGGAVNLQGAACPFTIESCTITNNRGGGVVLARTSEAAYLRNTIVARNSNGSGTLGGILASMPAFMINCTIFENTSGGGPAVDGAYGSLITLQNCIVWGNSHGEVKTGATVNFSDIEGGWTGTGTGNLAGTPADAPALDLETLRLTYGSPCIDEGDDTSAPARDIDGEPRPWPSDDDPDIGADEFQDFDQDGLPDSWEMEHAGTTDVAPTDDTDDDGFLNIYEYVHGSDPANPAAHPAARPVGTHFVSLTGANQAPYDTWATAATTIQGAIDASSSAYDIVVVADGLYMGPGNSDILFPTHPAMLMSQRGPESCTIDCQSQGRGMHVRGSQSRDTVILGLTVRNGLVAGSGLAGFGGGIACFSSGATIRECVVTNNQASSGGGIFGGEAPILIDRCTIVDNFGGSLGGGGVYLVNGGDCVLRDCLLVGNRASDEATYGGGVLVHDAHVRLENCLLESNQAWSGGGAYADGGASLLLKNCTVAGNKASSTDSAGGLDIGDGVAVLQNSIVWNNTPVEVLGDVAATYSLFGTTSDIQGEGVLKGNPRFLPRTSWLSIQSPCIDAGEANDLLRDLAGRPRWSADWRQGVSTWDMGAYEYVDCNHDGVSDDWSGVWGCLDPCDPMPCEIVGWHGSPGANGDVDLDIDSDNTALCALPDYGDEEDAMEMNAPGKVVVLNDNDDDGDGIPDFADGYNLRPSIVDDDINAEEQCFAPLVLFLADRFDGGEVSIAYPASPPLSVQYHSGTYVKPSEGTLRLWIRRGEYDRDGNPIGLGGDYVAPGVYAFDQLRMTPTFMGFLLTLYIERIKPGSTITVCARPPSSTGAPNPPWECDSVETGIIKVEIVGFTPSETYAPASDCPIANHRATCQATIEPAGVSTISYSIQGAAHGATIDASTGVITPSSTESGEIVVRAAATAFSSCYDEQAFLIKARPTTVQSSTVTEFNPPIGGLWVHTFNTTGGSLDGAQVKETVTMTNWPFRDYNAQSGSTWTLNAGGTMTVADKLWQPDYDFYASDFLPSPPKAGLPQSSLERQEFDWICPSCWDVPRDIEQDEESIIYTFSENTEPGHSEPYVIKLHTGYGAAGEPIRLFTNY